MRFKTIHYISTDDSINEKVAYDEHMVIPRIGEHVQYCVRKQDKVKWKVYVVADVVYEWDFQNVQIILMDRNKE